MAAGEIIRFTTAFFPRWRADLVERYLRTFELPLDRKVKGLSRGMRASSRCSWRCAAALLVLDEPTVQPLEGRFTRMRCPAIRPMADTAAWTRSPWPCMSWSSLHTTIRSWAASPP
jgi:hypothetical protein